MGSYQFKPYTVFAKSAHDWTVSPGSATSDAALVAAISSPGAGSIFVATLPYSNAFIVFVGAMYLDGSATPILTPGGMPAGFTITSCDLIAGNGSGALDVATNPISVEFDQLESFSLPGNGLGPLYTFPHPGAVPSVAHLFSDNLGYRIEFPGGIGNLNLGLTHLIAQGNYAIASTKTTMDPPSGDVSPGDIVTIEGPNLPAAISFVNAQGIVIPITVLIQDSGSLKFIIPVGTYGYHTIFSGSVPLGTLNILQINASGIYTLVPGKTNDTLYDNDSAPETMDVMIPSPFIKTGFVGG